ncbi:MAG TPA: cadmium resistance transporter [Candidatus Methanomethylophilaceae archaeon]|nr:cadmium resistance transporter [Candidatus Methanomethylophilaceae archaeon]
MVVDIILILLAGAVAAMATTIGEIAVLTMFYLSAPEGQEGRKKRRTIDTGYILGSIIGLLVSLVVAVILIQLPIERFLPWLGAIPIVIGLYYIFRPVADRGIYKAGKVMDKARSKLASLALYTIVTLALCMDDLGVFVPLLAVMEPLEMLAIVLVAIANLLFIVLLSRRISNIASIKGHIDTLQQRVVPLLFILIGIYIYMKGVSGL